MSTTNQQPDAQSLMTEVVALRARAEAAESALAALRDGQGNAAAHDPARGPALTAQSAEHPYRLMVEHMQEGAAMLTRDSRVIYGNARLASLLSLRPEAIVGHRFDAHVVTGDRPAFERLMACGSEGAKAEVILLADSRIVPVLLAARALPPDDEIVSLVVTDLTDQQARRHLEREVEERMKVEAELQRYIEAQARAEEELRDADRRKNEFLAMLGHELRNPLAAIDGAARVQQFATSETDIARAREVIERQVTNLRRLVDDLLDVARVATGRIELSPEALDLAEAARRVMAALSQAGQIAEHEVRIVVEPAWIKGDPPRVEQVISNLVGNALRYTPAQRRIEVRVAPADGQAVLEVADEGIGIDAAELPRLFDLFFQGSSGGHRAASGLGIGLTLVRHIVELHGGTISVSSDGAQRGCTFTVRLPLIAPVAEPASAESAPAPGTCRILVVDDHDDGREMLCLLLESEGHEVHQASDGPSALDAVTHLRPDVALIDLGLPGFSGLEVARRARALPGGDRMHLVALTGFGQPEDRAKSHEAGFDVHLVKPVEIDDLRGVLALVAERPRR